MNSLIWQSVMWRPGKLQFLIGVKNPLPIGRPRSPENAALAGPRPSPDSQIRSGYALPSSRIRRHFLILFAAATAAAAQAVSGLVAGGGPQKSPESALWRGGVVLRGGGSEG